MSDQTSAGRPPRRLDVDVLKALACVAVVLYHMGSVPLSTATGVPYLPGYYVQALLAACVPLFFFSSGVLYASRELTFRRAATKALRLAGLLVVWGLLAAAFYRALGAGELSLAGIVVDAVGLRAQVANWLWFLPVMAATYLLAPFLIHLRKTGGRLWDALVALLVLAAFGLDLVAKVAGLADLALGTGFGGKLSELLAQFSFLRNNHPEALAFFAVGMWAEGRAVPRRLARWAPAALLAMPALLGAYGAAVHAASGQLLDVTWEGYSCVTTLVFVLALHEVVRAACDRGLPRALSAAAGLVGRNSLAVYLLHWFLRPAMGLAVAWSGPGVARIAASLLVAVAVTLACAAAGQLARRTPLRPLLAG